MWRVLCIITELEPVLPAANILFMIYALFNAVRLTLFLFVPNANQVWIYSNYSKYLENNFSVLQMRLRDQGILECYLYRVPQFLSI